MARFNVPVTQLVTSDAASSASGWKLNFYSTGTTTRKDTFSDSALTTANANPVVADSAGRFGDIFMESGTYRVILTDANDVEIWDADPVDGTIGTSGAVDEKTAAYTVTVGDSTKILSFDATSGNITVTLLPAATAGDGFDVAIIKSDSSANTVTVDGNGSETINGATTRILKSQHELISLRSDGSGWLVTAETSPLTTRGDIILANAVAEQERLAVGSSGQALISDGTDPGWADVPLPRSYLAGLGLAVAADTDHDITFAVGEARDSTNAVNLKLASAQTKQIDASWATGSGAGGLSSSLTVANDTWYHCFVFLVGSTVECGFDTSLTAANLVTDHSATSFRRVGSVLTDGSANIIGFTQVGDEFLWDAPPLDINTTTLGTSSTSFALSTPLGVQTRAIIALRDITSGARIYVRSLDQTDEAVTSGGSVHLSGERPWTLSYDGTGGSSPGQSVEKILRTNTSSQIAARSDQTSTSLDGLTIGYIDRRGRDA